MRLWYVVFEKKHFELPITYQQTNDWYFPMIKNSNTSTRTTTLEHRYESRIDTMPTKQRLRWCSHLTMVMSMTAQPKPWRCVILSLHRIELWGMQCIINHISLENHSNSDTKHQYSNSNTKHQYSNTGTLYLLSHRIRLRLRKWEIFWSFNYFHLQMLVQLR